MAFITHSLAFLSLDGTPVELQIDIAQGLPGMTIIGMGNKAVQEAIQRVRSALKHADLPLPPKKYIINLAPSDLPKDGAHYDLAIAVGLMVAMGAVTQQQVARMLFFGELSLNGGIKIGKHPLFALEAATQQHFTTVFGPDDERIDPFLGDDVSYIGVTHLRDLFRHLKHIAHIEVRARQELEPYQKPDMLGDVIGQEQAKRALVIAITGGHHTLMIGPPGVGKSLLASATASLMPPLDTSEAKISVKLHALAHLPEPSYRQAPFRAPHHRITPTGLIGSAKGVPGEVSLAHGGILFLDEFSEFRRDSLEALRQPLQDHVVHIGSGKNTVTLPARSMVIAATNPCPCGMYGDTISTCRCPEWVLRRYQQRLSGPLLDRFDIIIRLQREQFDKKVCIKAVFNKQHNDLLKNIPMIIKRYDSHLKRSVINNASQHMLNTIAASQNLNMRAKASIIHVATTIALLEQQTEVQPSHIAEASQLRFTSWHG